MPKDVLRCPECHMRVRTKRHHRYHKNAGYYNAKKEADPVTVEEVKKRRRMIPLRVTMGLGWGWPHGK